MEYFNFCHFRLSPSVTSSVVSAEGYEVTNLISNDSTNQRGFMAYRTINPPVDITFTFMCKINISYIVIWPQIGNQKSTGFQVFTGRDGMTHSGDTFVNVGTGYLKNEPGIVFSHISEPTNSDISFFLRRKLSSRQNSLSCVKTVQIRIIKTHRSSIPTILKVEIWGLPSVSCPKEVRMKVLHLWMQKDKKIVTQKVEMKAEEYVLRSTAKVLVGCNLEIPEEFLDPITCEIMVLPFILPSGKTVDQRTLERHENHEANWGRRPNDPFTGKPYSESSKPVLAIALKARIDKFLLDHADMEEVKKVPRTLGRKLNSSSSEVNNLIAKGGKGNLEVSVLQSVSNEKQIAVHHKRKYEISETNCKNPKIEASTSCQSLQNNCFGDTVIASEISLKCSHEDRLNDSLNAALKSTLSDLPSFTNFNPEGQDVKSKCAACNNVDVLYILPCEHFLCRVCLMKKISYNLCNCSSCNVMFNSSDPRRFFP